jgi:predicted component of type VI protein secretion system
MAAQAQLVMRSGPTPGKTFTLTKPEMYIGRDISNDIVINDAEVSRKHVRLLVQAGQYVLEDLGSTNGTFINGQRISGPHILMAGQTVQMGENVVVVFEIPSFDPDATALMGANVTAMEPAPAPVAQAAPPPVASSLPPAPPPVMPLQPEPAATYTGQAPPPAMMPMEEKPAQKKGNRGLLYGGIGCAVILCCVIVGALYYIDANELWCSVLPFLGNCP